MYFLVGGACDLDSVPDRVSELRNYTMRLCPVQSITVR